MSAAMMDDDLIRAAGCGSYDGMQEHAMRRLLARLTAMRAIELYSAGADPPPQKPQRDYLAEVVKYSSDLGA